MSERSSFRSSGLVEVLVRAGVAEPSHLARRRVRREDDDRDVRGRGVEAKSLEDVEAVDVGQVHVEQYQFRVARLGDADAGTSLDRRQQLDVGPLEQESFDQLHVVEIVLDVKDRCHDESFALVSVISVSRHTSDASGEISDSGSSNQNVEPSSTTVSKPNVPPIASMSVLDNVRPSPVPSIPRVSASSRSNAVKSRSRRSGAMPKPVSETENRTTSRPGLAVQGHAALTSVELDRVGQQIQDHLLQSKVVGQHRVVEGVAEADADVSLAGLGTDDVEAFAHEFVEQNRLGRESDVARFDARDVEDLVDQRQQMLTGLEDVVDEFEVLLGRRAPSGGSARSRAPS